MGLLGIEKDETYIKGARERLAQITLSPESAALEYTCKRKLPRVPFGAVIERGLISPGDVLYDEKKRHKAVVRSDGTVKFKNEIGSIHQMGAMAQDSTTCNGWAYWYYVDEKKHKLICIDELRQIVRAEMYGE